MAGMLMFGMGVSAQVANGYYRIKNAGNGKYVQVRGRIQAAPDQTAAQTKTEAGSVIYVTTDAAPKTFTTDGGAVETRYRVANLRSQGIEVIGGRKSYDTYAETFNKLLANTDNVYPWLRQVQDEGYLMHGRAILEFGIWFVAKTLEENFSGTGAKQVADDFNKTIADAINIDMWITPTTTTAGEQAYYLNEHTVKLDDVVNFYKANADRFAPAFAAMRQVLTSHGIESGETIENDASHNNPEIDLFKAWGYDITQVEKYKAKWNGSQYDFTYADIFSDEDLLYNWLKLNIYKFLTRPEYESLTVGGKPVGQVFAKIKQSAYYPAIMAYFPRIHRDRDYFLIQGYVSNDAGQLGTAGTKYTSTDKFGFVNNGDDVNHAFGSERTIAGDAAKWVLEKVDGTDANYFGVSPNAALVGRDGKYYTTLFVDFPIDAAQNSADTHIYTVGNDIKDGTTSAGAPFKYLELTEETGIVKAQTPMVVECKSTNASDNRLVPQSDGSPRTFSEWPSTSQKLTGVFFDWDLNRTELDRRWGISYDASAQKVYTLNKNNADALNPMGFYPYSGAKVGGNKAFMIVDNAEAAGAKAFYLGGFGGTVVNGIDGVETSGKSPVTEIYDLQGHRVEKPVHGVYIINGKKVLVK